jgi:hypothetical protein
MMDGARRFFLRWSADSVGKDWMGEDQRMGGARDCSVIRVVGVGDDGGSMMILPVIAKIEIVGAGEASMVVAEWMAMQIEQVAGL